MPPKLTDFVLVQTLDAITMADGNREKAAKSLGISMGCLNFRVKHMPLELRDAGSARRRAVAEGVVSKAVYRPDPVVKTTGLEYKDTEARLWDAFHAEASIANRNALVMHYMHIVQYIASRVYRRVYGQCTIEDLESLGVDGLLDAIERFDTQRRITFSTYSVPRIQGSMMDGIRYFDPVPRLVRQDAKRRLATELEMYSELGIAPTDEQVRERLGWSSTKYFDSYARRSLSLEGSQRPGIGERSQEKTDDPGNDFAHAASSDRAMIQVTEMPYKSVERNMLMDHLLKSLNLEEKIIIYLYYFKDGNTMLQIAKMLHLSESRVSQCHSEIIKNLKVRFGESLKDILTPIRHAIVA